MVESILTTTTRVSTFLGTQLLTAASGFFFERDARLFLVTSRHVLIDQPLALAAYLTAIVHSEKPTETAETERALQDVRLWNPQFSTASAGKLTPLGIQCRKTHGTLHVIVLAGVAPEWVSESCEPTSAALLIADQILSAQSKHSLPPTLFSVKIARPQSTDPARADLTPAACSHARRSAKEPTTWR